MDDIKSSRNQYGSSPSPTTADNKGDYGQSQQPSFTCVRYDKIPQASKAHMLDTEHTNTNDGAYTLDVAKKTGKKRTVFLVLFILLFVIAAAFAAWQYVQVRDLKQQVTDLQQQSVQLNAQIYSLNYDNKDLKKQLELQEKELQLVTDHAKQLKDKCGSACNSITLQ